MRSHYIMSWPFNKKLVKGPPKPVLGELVVCLQKCNSGVRRWILLFNRNHWIIDIFVFFSIIVWLNHGFIMVKIREQGKSLFNSLLAF